MVLKDGIKQRAPGLYRTVSRLRSRVTHYGKILPARYDRWRYFLKGGPVTVEIGGRIGLGAILSHSCTAMRIGQGAGIEMALRFFAPTYQPTSGANDWLDCYFVRKGRHPGNLPTIDITAFPYPEPEPHQPHLIWDYLSIRPEIIEEALQFVGQKPYAAIHYRGTDKFIETGRVCEETVLRQAEREMNDEGLGRLFVASDENSFIQMAQDRFGHDVCAPMSSSWNEEWAASAFD